jgi:hypothetical protein
MSTDYASEFKALVEALGFSLNDAVESLNRAMDRNITLRENIACTVKDLEVTVSNSTTGTLLSKTTFKTDIPGSIIGMQVINATNLTDNTPPTSGIFVTYSQSANIVEITKVLGLPANKKFSIRIVAYI